MNVVTLAGRLGRDPEIRDTQNGTVANLSICTTKRSGGKSYDEWHRLVSFADKLNTQVIRPYCHKGDMVGVQGELRTRKWQDQSGNDRYTTEVVINQLYLLGSKSDRQTRDADEHEHSTHGGSDHQDVAAGEDFDDDIPF